MPSFRDDHILVISPGSQTTLAQLGLPESFTPAKLRLPSRMYPGLEEGTWVPVKVRELREGEDLAALLGVKNDNKKTGKVKKDVVVGNGAPKTAGVRDEKLEEGAIAANNLEGVVSGASGKHGTGSEVQQESDPTVTSTPGEGAKSLPSTSITTGASAPVPPQPRDNIKPAEDQDTEIPDADDNEGDEEELEDGEELEEGEDHEQEGEGEEVAEADDMILSDDEELAEGEEIIEDIIEMPETENGVVYVEDEDDDEGAVWPMQQGKVVNWGAFFALLTYVHELINPTFHTPILIICPPVWTRFDKELVTQFVFEKLRVPGLCLLDASLAVCWAYGAATATIIDVGFEKTDITPVLDFLVSEIERDTIPVGGEDMTMHLSKILGGPEKGWGREIAEQLKCSPICEILEGSKIAIPGKKTEQIADIMKKASRSLSQDIDEEEAEGITNVAAIVASGKTHEYLAKKEREKQEALKGLQKNLPNWKRETSRFWVTEKRKTGDIDVMMVDHWEPVPPSATEATAPSFPPTAAEKQDEEMHDHPSAPVELETSSRQQPPSSRPGTSAGAPPPGSFSRPGTSSGKPANDSQNPTIESEEARVAREKAEAREKRKEEKRAKQAEMELRANEVRREVDVGIERFQAAECGILTTIADAVYRIISRVDDIPRRQELWDNVIIVGNGAKVKGFKDTLLSVLIEKYKISPSSATIFTSELPSASSTPLPTGASTPLPLGAPQSSGVNPLLLAATTNNLQQQLQHSSHHTLSPMNIRLTKQPDYFPEWKDAGFEEGAFLGGQVAAKVVFVLDQGQNRGFLSRVEYNEMGPGGIHSV